MLSELAERLSCGLACTVEGERGALALYAGEDGGKGVRLAVSAIVSLDRVSDSCCDPCLTSASPAKDCLSIVQRMSYRGKGCDVCNREQYDVSLTAQLFRSLCPLE